MIGNPEREEENVIEADWVDKQQCVECWLLVQMAIARIKRFDI